MEVEQRDIAALILHDRLAWRCIDIRRHARTRDRPYIAVGVVRRHGRHEIGSTGSRSVEEAAEHEGTQMQAASLAKKSFRHRLHSFDFIERQEGEGNPIPALMT